LSDDCVLLKTPDGVIFSIYSSGCYNSCIAANQKTKLTI